MPKAYGYIRVSTEEQHISPEAQRDQINAYFEANLKDKGFTLADCVVDADVSGGKEFLKRKAGRALSARLEPGDAVIITKVDRGFRNSEDAHATARRWKEKGFESHFLDLGKNIGSASWELQYAMLAALAQFERKRMSERMKEMYAWKKRVGIPGRATWGFKLARRPGDTRKTILVPDRQLLDCAELIARLREERGYSYSDIARHCWENRIRPAPFRDIGNEKTVERLYHRYCQFRKEQNARALPQLPSASPNPTEIQP